MKFNLNIPFLIALGFGTKTVSVDAILSDFNKKAEQLAEAQDELDAQAKNKREDAARANREADKLEAEATRAYRVREKLTALLGL